MGEGAQERERADRGPIAWMVHNRVTPDLLMFVLLLGGLFMAGQVKQEVFPEFALDQVLVAVPYPSASPEEIEQGIVLAIEEAVRPLDGVKELLSVAAEGNATVMIEVEQGGDAERLYQDVQQAVARIRTLPQDAEEPQISVATRRREVLTVLLHGDAEEWVLRDLAEQARDRLLQEPDITQVEFAGARAYEIHVEVPEANLRRYGLTLDGIARLIDATAVDLPGGSVDTSAGEILVRMKERRDWAHQFAEIPVVTTAQGSVVRLSDIARVAEGFEDASRVASYDGRRAIALSVFRVGDETPVRVSSAVRSALEDLAPQLPPGIETAVQDDRSEVYGQRLTLLVKNAAIGLLLVLALLGLFLEPKLAFWVTMGIPTAFLGSLLFLPFLGVTINMISLFAFLIALGIVVDDAIVSGENVFELRERGVDATTASIAGARGVSMPIAFSILTNVVAFLPLYFIPGIFGKIWTAIPVVVTVVFLLSWVESLLVLPSHLAHARPVRLAALERVRSGFQRRFTAFVEERYAPFLAACVRRRYLTVAVGLAVWMPVVAYALSGRMGIVLMPQVEADRAEAVARLPYGSSDAAVERVRAQLLRGAGEVAAAHGGDALVRGAFALIEQNLVEIDVYLTPPGVRPLPTSEVARLWRDATGPLPGVQSVRFSSESGGPGAGAGITVELSHRDVDVLDRAGVALAASLGQFGSVRDVDDGYTPGKPQLDFRLRPEGRSLGLTSSEVARQVRNAFYGAEALRQQRARSEVRVKVRLPEAERASEHTLEQLLIRTPAGTDVPLAEVAEAERGRAYTQIARRDGRRTVTVTGDLISADEVNQVIAALRSEVLPALVRDFPGLGWSFEGRQAEMRDSLSALGKGFLVALAVMYALLAVPFGSFVQPLIVMAAIPFGVVGAVLGHLLMGYSLSVISMMGMIALSGVVVNDSLVMIDYANQRRREGRSAWEAIQQAGIRRFRPILLTTLTTFGGLAPMIFEPSRQARFMIPMALSLGYGIVFATLITLVLIPCFYLIAEDASALPARWRRRPRVALLAGRVVRQDRP